MTGALAGLLIDVQFYITATSAGIGSKGNANFFANFYIMLNFVSLPLQLFATPKIQDKIGIPGGLRSCHSRWSAAPDSPPLRRRRSVCGVAGDGGRLRRRCTVRSGNRRILIDSGDRDGEIAVDSIAARIAEGIAASALYIWVQQVAPGGVVRGRWTPLDDLAYLNHGWRVAVDHGGTGERLK